MAHKEAPEQKPGPEAAVPKEEPVAPALARWYRRRKTYIIAGAIIAAFIILQVILWVGLSYKSVTGEDLTIFLETEAEYLQVTQGEEVAVNFTLGVNNLAFCTAVCSWNATNGLGETVGSGSVSLPRGEHSDLGYAFTAPIRGTGTEVYQVQVSCTNPPAQYCQSSGKTRYASAITVVNTTYGGEKEEQAAALAERLPSWQQHAGQTLAALKGIAAVTDARVRTVRQAAAGEAEAWEQHLALLDDALEREEFAESLQLLERPPANLSLQAYGAAVELERQAADYYAAVPQRQALLNTLLAVTSAADHDRLQRSAQTASTLHDAFLQQPPTQSAAAFRNFLAITDELNRSYTNSTIEAVHRAEELLAAELRMGCVLKNLTCIPITPSSPSTLNQAAAHLSGRCGELAQLPQEFDDMHALYAAQLNASVSTVEVEAQYGVAAVRAESSFPLLAEQLRAAARNGTLLTQNSTIRLAVPLQPGNETAAFLADSCSLRNSTFPLPAAPLRATLPAAPADNVSLALALPRPGCCSLGECAACTEQQRYPVVFVHGHSFTDSAAPEYSLNAFTPFAYELQRHDYLYAGHVFPRDDLRDVPYGELGQLPSGLTFTATYYYNSYPEEGETRFVVRKSENIETYAIRLKEDIDLVKHRTGQQKVVLVAHSMGGLVSRRYLQLFGEQDVAALIMIGTPNNGVYNSTQELCPLFGGDNECADMAAGSVFLAKLNAGRQPSIPFYTFAGTGCSGRDSDGVVEASSVMLPFADNTLVEGSCPSRTELLHSALLDPAAYPGVFADVRSLLERHTR